MANIKVCNYVLINYDQVGKGYMGWDVNCRTRDLIEIEVLVLTTRGKKHTSILNVVPYTYYGELISKKR